jgi:3-hydroxyacyl-[acyl-carrier-protein] dehydratase
MRWFWIDRFTEFVSGEYAVAVKGVSLSEAHLHAHFPGQPLMPPSLVIEGLAQTGGLLFGEHIHFASPIVLAKVSRAQFIQHARPGDQLVYRAQLASVVAEGAMIEGTAHVGGELFAEVVLFLGVLSGEGPDHLFEPFALAGLLRMLDFVSVGRTADGKPIELPPALLEAERLAISSETSD